MTFANPPAALPASILAFVLDLDKNPFTGEDGIEAGFALIKDELGNEEVVMSRWDGAELVEITPAGAAFSYSQGVLTTSVPRTELLDTVGFEFGVLTLVIAPTGPARVLDISPEPSEPFWAYDLVGVPPPPPPPPPKLSASRPVGTPARPLAGKRFSVSSLVTNADTERLVATGLVTCNVRVGNVKIKATGRFGLRAQCTMTVPRNGKGKILAGRMIIRSGRASVTRRFSFRVS